MKHQELLDEILEGNNPVCLSDLGQSIVDNLCEIIRDQNRLILDLIEEDDKRSN